MRMIHELSGYNDAVFITLTYDNEHLPPNGTLVVADLQKFFKRLRKEVNQREQSNKIRYYACGEYGDNYGRPHYHAILFGLSLRTDDQMLIRAKWSLGRVHFGTVTPDSISYVAQYIDKKYTGDLAQTEYYDKGRAPVFKVCSLGIGRQFLEDNRDQLVHMGYVTVGGRIHSFPRYYLDKLGIDPEQYRLEAKYKAAEAYEDATGLNLDPDIAYRVRPAAEVRSYQQQQKALRQQQQDNNEARINHKRRKL